MKLLAVFFAAIVPFLALRDAWLQFKVSVLQGWSLALDMWNET